MRTYSAEELPCTSFYVGKVWKFHHLFVVGEAQLVVSPSVDKSRYVAAKMSVRDEWSATNGHQAPSVRLPRKGFTFFCHSRDCEMADDKLTFRKVSVTAHKVRVFFALMSLLFGIYPK